MIGKMFVILKVWKIVTSIIFMMPWINLEGKAVGGLGTYPFPVPSDEMTY